MFSTFSPLVIKSKKVLSYLLLMKFKFQANLILRYMSSKVSVKIPVCASRRTRHKIEFNYLAECLETWASKYSIYVPLGDLIRFFSSSTFFISQRSSAFFFSWRYVWCRSTEKTEQKKYSLNNEIQIIETQSSTNLKNKYLIFYISSLHRDNIYIILFSTTRWVNKKKKKRFIYNLNEMEKKLYWKVSMCFNNTVTLKIW